MNFCSHRCCDVIYNVRVGTTVQLCCALYGCGMYYPSLVGDTAVVVLERYAGKNSQFCYGVAKVVEGFRKLKLVQGAKVSK